MRGGVNEFLLDSRAPGGSSTSLDNTTSSSSSYYQRPSSSLGSSSSSSLAFNLKQEDGASTPGGSAYAEEEKRREMEIERRVEGLLEETRVWRLANSAQWVAWGIVQAKVPGLDGEDTTAYEEEDDPVLEKDIVASPGLIEEGKQLNGSLDQKVGENALVEKNGEAEEGGDEEDEFDYLAYAQHRALFFWGDVLSLGIMSKNDLPESLVSAVNGVEY